MGMFDYITVKYPLPIEGLPEKGWQTKHLDCQLCHFILTNDGRLIECVNGLELVNDEPVETGKKKQIDRNFEGAFSFHASVDDKWYEFQAIMIDGEVKKLITKVNGRPMPTGPVKFFEE